MTRIVIRDKHRTLVDDTSYDLSIMAAIHELKAGHDIIAQPFPDYSSDDISDMSPEAETIRGADFRSYSEQEIYEYLRGYYQFGKA